MKQVLIRWAGLVLVAALFFALGYYERGVSEDGKASAATAKQLREAFDQGQALGTVRDQVVTVYVDRDRVIEGKTKIIVQKVPVYVSEAADRACTVNAGFVRVHDASAAGLPAPDPAGTADEAGSGVALSTVAATVAGNYGICEQNANQLTQLQALLKQYQDKQRGGQ
jgi:hypothetical protein